MDNPIVVTCVRVILVLSVITSLILSIIAFTNNGSSNKSFDELNNKIDEFTKSIGTVVSTQSQSLNSGTRGLQGPRGPSGPQGPPGMSYSAAGQLLNMATKTVATPTAGKGLQSILYLDNKNNSPMQYWFLENNLDGTVSVKNKYSDRCLNTDGGNNVFSDVCRDNNDQKFIWKISK